MDVATPATFERYLGSTGGANFDMLPVPSNFGMHRLPSRTPIPGLFLPKFSHGIWPSLQAGLQMVDMITGGEVMGEVRQKREKPAPRTLMGKGKVDELVAAVERSEAVQDELWAQARTMAAQPSAMLSAYLRSLASLTDLQMKRVRATVWNRIPTTIVVMLYAIGCLGLLTMGYGAGLADNRAALPTLMEYWVPEVKVSGVHVYLTFPFVLSWSMLEAMSAGCLLVASATPAATARAVT